MSKYTEFLGKVFKDNLNDKVFKERTRQSLEWYRKKINSFFGSEKINLNNPNIIDEFRDKIVFRVEPGWIYSFRYRPKHKNKLPYYDIFPLTLVIKKVPGGFIGLNFHYLPPMDRAEFMDKLYKFQVPNPQHTSLIINTTYNTLKRSNRLRFYKACIKRYKYSQIGNFFVPVYPHEWDMALFLPTEQFVGAKREEVWEDSREKY